MAMQHAIVLGPLLPGKKWESTQEMIEEILTELKLP